MPLKSDPSRNKNCVRIPLHCDYIQKEEEEEEKIRGKTRDGHKK